MKGVDYDSDADAISVDISDKKVYRTAELTEHILIDFTYDGKIAGLEILDASEEISKLFNRKVSKPEIKQLLCQITEKPNNEYLIQFNSPKKHQIGNLLISLYRSPLIS